MGSDAVSYVVRKHILKMLENDVGSRDSVVGVTTGYGLDERVVGVLVPVGTLHFVQTGSGVQTTSSLMSTGGSFSGDKAAGT
jgi:hypothetical protein